MLSSAYNLQNAIISTERDTKIRRCGFYLQESYVWKITDVILINIIIIDRNNHDTKYNKL